MSLSLLPAPLLSVISMPALALLPPMEKMVVWLI